MTITFSVSEVVETLRTHSVGSGQKNEEYSSNYYVGGLFHRVAADILRKDSKINIFDVLKESETQKDKMLSDAIQHIYDQTLGPSIYRSQSMLKTMSGQTVGLWKASESLANWLIDFVWACKPFEQDDIKSSWNTLKNSFSAEVPMEATLSDPSWSESVHLTGIADILVQTPKNKWCAIELKTGQAPDDLALLQACLYAMLLQSNQVNVDTVAIARFGVDVQETIFTNSQITPLSSRLISLIGSKAGVIEPIADPPPKPKPKDQFPRELRGAYRALGLDVSVVGEPIVGPTFKRYKLNIGRGTTWGKLQKTLEDLQIKLDSKSPLSLHRDVGRIYMDVVRSDRQVVKFADCQSAHARENDSSLLVGVDVSGVPRYLDLSSSLSPHVLVVGTTGSGKSEWLNMALGSLALNQNPSDLRFVLIDPKQIAFMGLRNSPFLWEPAGLVLPPDDDVFDAFDKLIDEMGKRYTLFAKHDVNNIDEYIATTGTKIPRIVCVCDEFMDLMLSDRKQKKAIEERVARLGAKARASGIHLILATQQPRRDIISGIIQANLPARVTLRTSSHLEARMVNCEGADRLLGKGDLLLKCLGEPVRLQAPLLSKEERRRILLKKD